MSDTMVLYKSHYGSTKQYAQWISEALGCECEALDDFDFAKLDDYSTVIYGGGLYAGRMLGLKTLNKHAARLKDANVILFAVGLSSADPKTTDTIRKANAQGPFEGVPFFFFQGKMDFGTLRFKHRIILKGVKRFAGRKEPLSESEKNILSCIDKPLDMVERSMIRPLLDHMAMTEAS